MILRPNRNPNQTPLFSNLKLYIRVSFRLAHSLSCSHWNLRILHLERRAIELATPSIIYLRSALSESLYSNMGLFLYICWFKHEIFLCLCITVYLWMKYSDAYFLHAYKCLWAILWYLGISLVFMLDLFN